MTSARIGILGTGSLAAAIVTGLSRDVTDPPEIVLSPRGTTTSARLAAEFAQVHVAADNQQVLDQSGTVLLCLRQGDLGALDGLTWRADQTVVSAVAGLGHEELARVVAPAAQVARAVPIMAVATRSWATPVRPALPAAVAVFDRTGGVLPVESDEEFDAIYTGLGTIAPLFDYLATIEGFLVDHGLASEDARTLVAQNISAALSPLGQMAAPDFAELLREHAPAGGGNDQLATLMRGRGVPEHTRAALDEVFRRQTAGRWAGAGGDGSP